MAILKPQSVRRKTEDGFLHVASSNISKSVVNPYLGKEIPGWEDLGLDPDKKYLLWRHPKELARAAPTFNNLPVLADHVPITAEHHQPELVIGSSGTDAQYQHPYLRNSLVFWPQAAIDSIEDNDQRELSCAYHYDPVMTPGVTPDGQRYDGIMTNIRGNHIALVEDGRAGNDVLVADTAAAGGPSPVARRLLHAQMRRMALRQMHHPVGAFDMHRDGEHPLAWMFQNPSAAGHSLREQSWPRGVSPMVKMSPAALAARSALYVYLRPRLAADHKDGFDYGKLVNGLTSKNYAKSRDSLIQRISNATRGKLAQDADLSDLSNLIDALKGQAESADQMATAPSSAAPPPGTAPATPPPADSEGEDIIAKIKSYLEEQGVSPEIIQNLDAFAAEGSTGGEAALAPPNGGGAPPEGGNGGDRVIPPTAGDEGSDPDMPARGGETDDLTIDAGADCPPGQDEEEDDEEKRKAAEDEIVPSEQPDLLNGRSGGGGGASDRNLVTRAAMDKAIKLAQDRAIQNQRAIRDAERFVRPWVGELAMDANGPADIYRGALKMLGVKGADKMHPDALRPVLEAQPRPSRVTAQQRAVTLAADSQPQGSFLDRFPEASKIVMQ